MEIGTSYEQIPSSWTLPKIQQFEAWAFAWILFFYFCIGNKNARIGPSSGDMSFIFRHHYLSLECG